MMNKNDINIGSHLSISGGLSNAIDRAMELKLSSLQIFSGNPRGWTMKPLKQDEIDKFKNKRSNSSIKVVVVHAPYLINIATDDKSIYNKSFNALKDDLKRTDNIGAEYYVFHPGNHKGIGTERGIENISQTLNRIIKDISPRCKILLETTSGTGTSIGSKFEELANIISLIESDNIGVCLDTCHVYAAGYDISNSETLAQTLNKFDKLITLDKLKVLHLNDSKEELGSMKDRHDHIGKGQIGITGFTAILNNPVLKKLPMILETPKKTDKDDLRNIETILSLLE